MRKSPHWLRVFFSDQRVRFLTVGGINTVVGYLLFALFDTFLFGNLPFGYLISLVLSYLLAIMLAFVLYRKFVFVVSGRLWLGFIRFVSVYLVSIGANFILLPLLVELANVPPLLAQAIILVATTLLSFFGHRHFSFRR